MAFTFPQWIGISCLTVLCSTTHPVLNTSTPQKRPQSTGGHCPPPLALRSVSMDLPVSQKWSHGY